MSVQDRILSAAEARVRRAGYNGFSFRDIAQDTGLTNAGVHHHFPTKVDLMERLTEVYTSRFVTALQACPPKARVSRLRDLFAKSLQQDGKMCLCGVLASESADLPEPVTSRVRTFFCELRALLKEGLPDDGTADQKALNILAQLEGAALLATVFSDHHLFDQATQTLR